MKVHEFGELDNVLLDGLDFCKRVYHLFDEIRTAPNGIEELRMRRTRRAKKVIEELLPLAGYVQIKYEPALRLRIRWRAGNQSYDAIVNCSGMRAERGEAPKRHYIEVTTAAHSNEYLVREHLNRTGGAFAARSTHRDSTSKQTRSEPSVYSYRELEEELISQVNRIVEKKQKKSYPSSTTLLIQCTAHSVILEDEWSHVVEQLRRRKNYKPFLEVVLYEPISRRMSTLHKRSRRMRRPTMR